MPEQGCPRGKSDAWARRLRDSGHTPLPRTDTRDLLVPPFPGPTGLWTALGLAPREAGLIARATGWAGPLLVALLAGAVRFWRLGSPHAVVFDETYYAKDAWSMLRFGYEGTWPDRKVVDPEILAHQQALPLSDAGSFVAHPPMGKWVIALGEGLFGLDPFGWRFMTALLGTLSVLMLCRIGRRLLRSTFLGCLAGTLLALDGLHFVMSRTALLDLIVMFFTLAAFGCLLVDRDRARAALAASLPVDADGRARPDARAAAATGTGVRPWRLAAGGLLGLAAAGKWYGRFVVVVFTGLTLRWDGG
ncbi:phospholipid carrier-dependent glycosyltransferase, partial [Streptomyces sp. NPDC096080]|uniref:phospholipid carrier-dependent glycosyltransferase n=1 Tax=Streptomyces sp. NPDC096080 TaxID=3156693 RepID=UPI00331BC74D